MKDFAVLVVGYIVKNKASKIIEQQSNVWFTDSYSEHMVANILTMKHGKQLTQCKNNLTKTLLFICPILILFFRVYAFYFD